MTKLKKPITVTIETAEELLSLWHRVNVNDCNFADYFHHRPSGHQAIVRQTHTVLFGQFDRTCKEAGIDPYTWNPPAPLIVAGHEATFNSDGSIKVGCQTIPKETMELVVKRWQEAGKVDDVWPKWCHNKGDKSTLEFHKDHSKSLWHHPGTDSLPIAIYANYERALTDGFTPITHEQAESLIGNQSLTSPE